jgi:uncharacterized radical SAM superfamily Fe-S cluster-containing enzyme
MSLNYKSLVPQTSFGFSLNGSPLGPASTNRDVLKRTTSRCPLCHVSCPAEVYKTQGPQSKVMLSRVCPEHGEADVCIASDARFYWLAKGRDRQGGCCGSIKEGGLNPQCCSADGSNKGTLGKNALNNDILGVMEKLSTCLCLIEIVNSCNLPCPTCYANSRLGVGSKVDAYSLENIKERVSGVISRKGKIEILQLSGGEPTLHPEFFELLEWLHQNPNIDYVLLNTNGLRIASDDEFYEKLKVTYQYGKFQLYLQYDGPQEQGQKLLRGSDLRKVKEKCIQRCAEARIPVTLAMTVTPENISYLWESIEFGLKWDNIRGVSFQPMFGSGRVPRMTQPENRLNVADIILSAVEGSKGKLRFEDFTPLPCGDPNCATIGYLLKVNGQVRSVSDFIDFSNLQTFLGTKVKYKLEDLMKCGCESEPLGELLKKFELDESHTFRLFIKPFMDAWTWDDDRIDRCCTHVIRPDGKLDSFCRYYSGFKQ